MKNILVHIHLFYPEFWKDIEQCVKTICAESKATVYISMIKDYPDIFENLKQICPNSHKLIVENKGWDIASFIEVINKVNLDEYDYVVKLHTKRDIAVFPWYINGYDVSGDKWRKYGINFCYTKENWKSCLNTLQKQDVGMVADYHLIAKNDLIEEKLLEKLCHKLDITAKNKLFCNVSMFAAKPEILKKIQNKIKFDDFESTVRSDKDCDLAHLMEVMFGYILEDKKIADFKSRKSSSLRFALLKIKKFIYHKKVTKEKISIKVCGVTIYKMCK